MIRYMSRENSGNKRTWARWRCCHKFLLPGWCVNWRLEYSIGGIELQPGWTVMKALKSHIFQTMIQLSTPASARWWSETIRHMHTEILSLQTEILLSSLSETKSICVRVIHLTPICQFWTCNWKDVALTIFPDKIYLFVYSIPYRSQKNWNKGLIEQETRNMR